MTRPWLRLMMPLALASGVTSCTEEEAPRGPLASLPSGAPTERADPYLRSPSTNGTVQLYAGFNPDPAVVEGEARGRLPAGSIHRRCRGWVSEAPEYLLATSTAFLQLQLRARSSEPISLIVRKPDGSVVCKGLRKRARDPFVRTPMPIGTSQIWIGVAREGATASYELAFSEVGTRARR